MNKIALSAAIVALLGSSVFGHHHHHHYGVRRVPVSYVQFIDNLDVDENQAQATADKLRATGENMGSKGYEKALNKAIN